MNNFVPLFLWEGRQMEDGNRTATRKGPDDTTSNHGDKVAWTCQTTCKKNFRRLWKVSCCPCPKQCV